MIEINLIPPQARKDNKGVLTAFAVNLPHEILLGVGGGLVLLLLAVHLVLGAAWFVKAGQVSFYKMQWQRILPDKHALDAISHELKDLQQKKKIVGDLTTKKAMAWSKKFNAISDALPKGLWLRKINLDKGGLVMEGTAVSKNKNEIVSIGNFISNLKKEKSFTADFTSIEVNSIQRGKRNAVEVADFALMVKLK